MGAPGPVVLAVVAPTAAAPQAAVVRQGAVARTIADGTGETPVAANGDRVAQTRDPYHGVRDRGQCGPAAACRQALQD